MPWSEMLFPLLFLALGAACLWAAWVFRRFAKKRETAYTVKAWAQVVQVLASADSDGDPLYTPVLHLLAEGEGYTKRGLPHPGGRPVPNGRLGGGALSSRQALPLYAGGRGGDLRRKCGAVPGGLSLLCGGAGAASPKLESLFLGRAP